MATFQEVVGDLNRAVTRAAQSKHLDTRPELVNNVYPMILQLLEACNERFTEVEEAVNSIIDETETIIQTDEAETIVQALDAGMLLAEAAEKYPDLAPLVASYKDLATKAAELVGEVTLADDEDDDDDDDEDDDEDEDDAEGDK